MIRINHNIIVGCHSLRTCVGDASHFARGNYYREILQHSSLFARIAVAYHYAGTRQSPGIIMRT